MKQGRPNETNGTQVRKSVKQGHPVKTNGTCVQKSVEQVEGGGILNKIIKYIWNIITSVCAVHAIFKSLSGNL